LLEPGEPKDPDTSTVFQIWKAFASEAQTADMRKQFQEGIAWGEAKKCLFELVNSELAEPRERYLELMADPAKMESILLAGAEKARAVTAPKIQQVREAIGIRAMKSLP
jgi:tryptophanyl-tRNA synthetase